MKIPAEAREQTRGEASHCLCVDLDGTLVQTDTMLESLLVLIRAKPLRFFRILFWACMGKARFKQELGHAARIYPDELPYARPVLDYIESEWTKGRKLFLVTGADASIAIPVAEHLGFFSEVICSNGRENVTGTAKLEAIRRVLGHEDFGYAGNSRADLPIWKAAKSAVIAGGSTRLRKTVESSGVTIEKVIPGPRFSIRTIAKAMRVHQWMKNVLVLLPVFLGHRLLERGIVLNATRAFLAFSFCASAIYLINDLLDLPTDRKHAEKRQRPLAAGELSISTAIILAAFLFAAAAVLNPVREAGLLLALYSASAVAYSLYLKRLLMVDIIMLAGFYTVRLLYGGAATRIGVSVWTLAFSMFMFLSLALIKRISELSVRSSEEGLASSGRNYLFADLQQLSALCAASGFVAALVFILYVRSPEVLPLYSRPQLLLGIFPLLVYWQSRFLILATRGKIREDPIMFSFSDRASQAVALAILAIVAAAV
jgi:4-hydroxybenzoate polyprenyltransferase/phosphoserine phosphatase